MFQKRMQLFPKQPQTMILCLLVTLLFGDIAIAKTFESQFECVVRSNRIFEIEDGQSKEYSGQEGRFQVGDRIRMDLSLDPDTALTFKVFDYRRGQKGHFVTIAKNYVESVYISDDYLNVTDKGGRYIVSENDRIIINSDGQPWVVMTRYWKNDWNVSISSTTWHPLSTHVYTASCTHKIDNLEHIKDKLNAWN